MVRRKKKFLFFCMVDFVLFCFSFFFFGGEGGGVAGCVCV